MQTEAYFEDIADRIIEEIQNSKQSIYIAVAWFTNKNIFNQLINKAKEGCSIHLIISNDRINENSHVNYDELIKYSGKVYKIGNGENVLMHNKFCVIDYNTVISGSYNWSYKAESNYENIVINYDHTALAERFVKEFIQIKNRCFPEVSKIENDFPLEIIIKRLETLKNFIILEDLEDLRTGISKLARYRFNKDIDAIVEAIESHSFTNAILSIQTFITNYQQLTLWHDPEIAGLKLELAILENQINAFDNEKIELEKILSSFQRLHTIELGGIILEILRIRKDKYKNDYKKSKETTEDYEEFNEHFQNEKYKHQFELNEKDKKELKKNFRKATMLCHPDKTNEDQKQEATSIFVNLKEAYDQNDLEKVNRILYELETNSIVKIQEDPSPEKQKLKIILKNLRQKIKQLELEIISLKESEMYLTIKKIKIWNVYFSETKKQLQQELESLMKANYK